MEDMNEPRRALLNGVFCTLDPSWLATNYPMYAGAAPQMTGISAEAGPDDFAIEHGRGGDRDAAAAIFVPTYDTPGAPEAGGFILLTTLLARCFESALIFAMA